MAQVNPTPEHGQEDPRSPVELGVKSAEITHFPIKHPQERGRFRLLKGLGLSLTALTVLAGIGYGAYETNNDFHQFVDSTYQRIVNILNYEGPQTFDNQANRGVVGENNMLIYPLADIQKKFPEQIIGNDNSVTSLWPFTIPLGTKIEYDKGLSEQIGDNALRDYADKLGIKDHIKVILPKGAKIIAPATGHVLITGGLAEWGQNPATTSNIRVFVYNPKNDTTYEYWFFPLSVTAQEKYDNGFRPLIPTQDFLNTSWIDGNWEKLPVVEQGQDLAQATQDKHPVELEIRVYNGKIVGPRAVENKTVSLATPNFFAEDNKAVALSN